MPTANTTSENWWENDKPIDSTEHDRFNAYPIAKRIANHIRNGRSVAITGPFGSGKTTIQELAEKELDAGKFWSVCIEGWGLADEDAPGRLLRQILGTLSQRTDAIRFHSLPKEYRAAIRGVHTTTGLFLDAIASPQDPFGVLAELDQTLAVIGVTVVVRLEDLDRNAGVKEQDQGMRQAAALLDRLHQLKHITFMIAIDAGRAGAVDLLRLCDFTEPLPPFQPGMVVRELQNFTKERLGLNPEQIELGDESKRSSWFGRHSNLFHTSGKSVDSTSDLQPYASAMAIARVLNTPRKLKKVLRQADQAWAELRGEVEPIDLLVETTLRVSADQAWTFIVAEIDNIRRIKSAAWFTQDDARKKEVTQKKRKRLHDRLSSLIPDPAWQREDIDILIHHLFGHWLSEDDASAVEGFWHHDRPKQSSVNYQPTDYLRRLIRGSAPESPTDQAFSQAMNRWQQTEADQDFVSMMHDSPHAAAQFEYFCPTAWQGDILKLADQLYDYSRQKFGGDTHFDSSSAHASVWRFANHKKPKRVSRFLRIQLRKSVAVSATLTTDIKYYWTSDQTITNSDHVRRRAQQLLGALCKRHLVNHQAWLKMLPNFVQKTNGEDMVFEKEYVLWHLMRWHEDTWTPEWWRWATEHLLNAADLQPKRLAPLLRVLVSKTHEIPPDRTYSIDEDFVQRWCPNPADQKRLLRILARPALGVYTVALHEAVRVQARTLLDALPEPAALPATADTTHCDNDASD